MSDESSSTVEHFGPYSVEITHPDRVLFPRTGLTKIGLAAHYRRFADAIVPHLAGRPLTQQRFPAGVDEEGFYQKEMPDSFPEWVSRCRVELKEPKDGRKHQVQAVCDNAATLAVLVQHGCVTPHVWTSRCDRLDRPDQMVFDLDPSGDDFDDVRFAARALRRLLDRLEVTAFLKTTGSRGVHVHVPLRRAHTFDEVRSFAHRVAGHLAEEHPDRLTVEQRKAKRGDRLYLDVARNAWGQTTVPPFAVRALPCAPIAHPIPWSALDDPSIGPQSFRVDNARSSVDEPGRGTTDPWEGFARRGQTLRRPREHLRQLGR